MQHVAAVNRHGFPIQSDQLPAQRAERSLTIDGLDGRRELVAVEGVR